MAVDMFLELKGSKGETGDSVYKGKMASEILSWSWGVRNDGTFHSATGGGKGKATIEDVSVTKFVDSASPNLCQFSVDGTHIPEGSITCRRSGGKAAKYLVVSLKKILVSSYATGASTGDGEQVENVKLNFQRVKLEYFKQTDEGGEQSGGDMTWNIPANKKEF